MGAKPPCCPQGLGWYRAIARSQPSIIYFKVFHVFCTSGGALNFFHTLWGGSALFFGTLKSYRDNIVLFHCVNVNMMQSRAMNIPPHNHNLSAATVGDNWLGSFIISWMAENAETSASMLSFVQLCLLCCIPLQLLKIKSFCCFCFQSVVRIEISW